jgi:hypothetical protein
MQNHSLKIEHRDPKSLRLHKLRKHFPPINKDSSDWIALTDSVAASGILQPLLITAEGFIADGGWRWEAAKDWQLKEVPCQIVADDAVGVIIAETLLARKQMTRGAAVYLILPIVSAVVLSAEHRRLDNLKQGRKTNEIELKPQCFSMSSNWNSDESQMAVRNLCFRLGVSKSTFYQARLVWELLNEPTCAALKKLFTDSHKKAPANISQIQTDFRNELEPQLLMGEKNLWNVESGIKGALTGGAHEPPNKQLELFDDALEKLAVRMGRFASTDEAGKRIGAWLERWQSELNISGKSADEIEAEIKRLGQVGAAIAAQCKAAITKE